jgi:hypothetical protein
VYTRAPETSLCFMVRVIVWAGLEKLLRTFPRERRGKGVTNISISARRK